MPEPFDLQEDALWRDGAYELAIELGDRDDARLGSAIAAVWRAAGVEGCLGLTGRRPRTYEEAPCSLDGIRRHGELAGIVRLPRQRRVVCGLRVVREATGTDRLDFFIPLGALERAEPRSAAFPFRGGDSLLWRRPLDKWFAQIGMRLYEAVPYRLGLIGAHVSGVVSARQLGGAPPMERWVGYLIPDGGRLVYHHADR